MVITTAHLHSAKPELRLCAGSNPDRSVSKFHDGEDLWQWSGLEIKAKRLSSINHATKTMYHHHHHHHNHHHHHHQSFKPQWSNPLKTICRMNCLSVSDHFLFVWGCASRINWLTLNKVSSPENLDSSLFPHSLL